jgi:hypothetical protein
MFHKSSQLRISYLGMDVPPVIPGEDQMPHQSFELRISYLGMDVPPVIPA